MGWASVCSKRSSHVEKVLPTLIPKLNPLFKRKFLALLLSFYCKEAQMHVLQNNWFQNWNNIFNSSFLFDNRLLSSRLLNEADFCENLILISKSRLSRKTLISVSTLNFLEGTLIFTPPTLAVKLSKVWEIQFKLSYFSGIF